MQRTESPVTAVLLHYSGIGDLVWHIPYLEAIARSSADGQVTLIASPTTLARDLLSGHPQIRDVVDFDRRPRKAARRAGHHAGIGGLLRFAMALRRRRFQRIIVFSHQPNRSLIAALAGIPQRYGFGSHWLARLLLNRGKFIAKYGGSSVAVFKDAASFCVANGWCQTTLVPRLAPPSSGSVSVDEGSVPTRRPVYVFAIGTSEPSKQWGAARFAGLATKLLSNGCGVLMLGGRGEAKLAQAIIEAVPAELRSEIRARTDQSILETLALLHRSDACVGNDTGVTNMAVACGRPTFVLLGARPLLDLDPLMTMIRAASLDEIDVDAVWLSLAMNSAPGIVPLAQADERVAG